MADLSAIREHMNIIGADGVHVGTVDKVEGDRIKLTKKDQDRAREELLVILQQIARIRGEQIPSKED